MWEGLRVDGLLATFLSAAGLIRFVPGLGPLFAKVFPNFHGSSLTAQSYYVHGSPHGYWQPPLPNAMWGYTDAPQMMYPLARQGLLQQPTWPAWLGNSVPMHTCTSP